MDKDAEAAYFRAFICLHGDVDNAALTEEGCFTVEDSQSRSWVCWACRDVYTETDAAVKAVCAMQDKLRSAGYFNTGGTRMFIFAIPLSESSTWEEQIEELRTALGESGDDDDEGEEWKRGKQQE